MSLCAILLLATLVQKAADQPFRLPDSLVCGNYYWGDGEAFNQSLTLRSNHTFDFGATTDTHPQASDRGSWDYDGDVLVLKPENPSRFPILRTDTRFIPVAWGQAVTLVEENHAPAFLATPNQDPTASDTIHSLHYRKLDAKKSEAIVRTGKMLYPPRFDDFVTNGPITGKVTQLQVLGMVTITAQQPGRLQVGMMLATSGSAGIDFVVTKLTQNGALAKTLYSDVSRRWVKKGDLVTTGNAWTAPMPKGTRYSSIPPRG